MAERENTIEVTDNAKRILGGDHVMVDAEHGELVFHTAEEAAAA